MHAMATVRTTTVNGNRIDVRDEQDSQPARHVAASLPQSFGPLRKIRTCARIDCVNVWIDTPDDDMTRFWSRDVPGYQVSDVSIYATGGVCITLRWED